MAPRWLSRAWPLPPISLSMATNNALRPRDLQSLSSFLLHCHIALALQVISYGFQWPQTIWHPLMEFSMRSLTSNSARDVRAKHLKRMDKVTRKLQKGCVPPAIIIALPLAKALASENLTTLLSSSKPTRMMREATSGGVLATGLEVQKHYQLLKCTDILFAIGSANFFSSSSQRSLVGGCLAILRKKPSFRVCSSLHAGL